MTLLKTFEDRLGKDSLGALDAQAAAALVATAADVALVLDAAGVVRDKFIQDEELGTRLGAKRDWIGRSFTDLLNPASRSRAQTMLTEALAGKGGKWRHLNHVGSDGADLPVLYAGSVLRHGERVVLFGRDLRPMSLLQQRLIDAQQSMERDHARMRHLELRYRLLFAGAGEPTLVLNAATQKITEANPAMAGLLDRPGEELAGQLVCDLFEPRDRAQVIAGLAATRTGGQAAPFVVRLDTTDVTLHLTLFREDNASSILLRAVPVVRDRAMKAPRDDQSSMLRLVEQAPDAFVVTDATGHVTAANAAFLTMAELGATPDAIGRSLDRWLGQSGVDLPVLLNNLRQRGTVRLFATTLTGASGIANAVEVSAVSLAGTSGGESFGFALRDVERRVAEAKPGRELPRSVDQLTELIGRVALKDLVREATDMIERLCIEAALEMTNDNRASAAELLGLSRQSLYVKLHRYGLGDLLDAPG